MANIIIKETTLPDGSTGSCGYLNITDETLLITDRAFIQDKTYTLSFYAKAESDKTVTFLNGFDKQDITDTITVEWKKIKLTFVAKNTFVGFELPGGTYWLYQAQIEDGELATNWNPSLGDSDLEKERYETLFEQTEQAIRLEVERANNVEGELKSAINLTSEGLSAEVKRATKEEKELKSTLDLLAGQIEVSVKVNESYNGMVINEEGVLFEGDGSFKVDLTNLKVDKDGNIEISGKIKSNSAEITGGNIKIETSSETEDIIKFSYHTYDEEYDVPIDYTIEESSSRLLLTANKLDIPNLKRIESYSDNKADNIRMYCKETTLDSNYNAEYNLDISCTDGFKEDYRGSHPIVGPFSGECEYSAKRAKLIKTSQGNTVEVFDIDENGANFGIPLTASSIKTSSGADLDAIGANNTAYSSAITLENNTTKVCQSVILPEGHVYLVLGSVSFSASTNGLRHVELMESETANFSRWAFKQPGTSAGGINGQNTKIYDCRNSKKTAYLKALQNSGADMTVYSSLSYVTII